MYRALDHGAAKANCKKDRTITQFPDDVQDFANFFVSMQEKRHRADYDPPARFFKSEVLLDIAYCEDVIARFMDVSPKDRRAFAAYVLFKKRPD